MKKKLVVLYGGRSAEKEVSVLSAFSVLKAVNYEHFIVDSVFIDASGKWLKGPTFLEKPVSEQLLHLSEKEILAEARRQGYGQEIPFHFIYEKEAIVFPVLHGPMGEDGTIQGLFETMNMAYVGCGVLASACGMDKIITKQLLETVGIPQVSYVPVLKDVWEKDGFWVTKKCEEALGYPMFVKPANMGSSVGISKATNKEELLDALKLAFQYDARVLVEKGCEQAREVEVAILGNEDVRVSFPGEVLKDVAFYDYNAKYVDNKVQLQIPAQIEEGVAEKIRQYAKLAYQTIDGSGFARGDFFLLPNGEIFLNELNTIPGFTQFSMYPLLWENMGLSYTELIEELIRLAEKRFAIRQSFFAGE